MYVHPYFTRFCCSVGLALFAPMPAMTAEVTLKHGDYRLLADFVVADESKETVALITHGTLAHKDMELIETLQDALAERGVSSLAHTLSLNIDERRGIFDCALLHTHKDEDADAEISAWIGWLEEKGHESIALVGHSRGGKQVARTAAGRDAVAGVVLMAPATAASAQRAIARVPDLQKSVISALVSASAEPRKLKRFLYCEDTSVSLESLLSYYGSSLQGTKLAKDAPVGAETYVGKISAPTLVVAGSKDTVVPLVPAIFMPLRSDTLKFSLIEDADHMFLDFYAEDAADVIAEFITELPPKPTVDFAAADVEYGEYLAQECLACHKTDGAEGVPGIAGQEAWYLYNALGQYGGNVREHAAMRMVARSLDDEQRIAVSAYFASLETDQ